MEGAVEGFERVFDLVGGHGLFQWRLFLIVSLQLTVLTWHHIGYAFLGAVPDHWCTVPELSSSNGTLDQQKQISLPRIDSDNPETVAYDQCRYFDLNYAKLLQNNFKEAYGSVDWENVTTKVCSLWNYDKSTYQSTVVTQFSLVCENRWKVATIQGSYMGGGLVGVLTFGGLSDKFLGRRLSVLICLLMVILAGLGVPKLPRLTVRMFCRMIRDGWIDR